MFAYQPSGCGLSELEIHIIDFVVCFICVAYLQNRLSSAISATSFVSCALNETTPLVDEESRQSAREDMKIIDQSLHFINDLLRNMLDMNRASSNQMSVEIAPAAVIGDIFEPVVSMIHRRGSNFEILVDCPPDMVVSTDRLRLKQAVFNLARNSTKFVEKGFIRFRAELVNGNVCLYIEDSGPGIAPQKRDRLFEKFQESLDSMNQGTGVGLVSIYKSNATACLRRHRSSHSHTSKICSLL